MTTKKKQNQPLAEQESPLCKEIYLKATKPVTCDGCGETSAIGKGMSEPKFTKGPWKVQNNLSYSDRKYHYQILTKDAGLWVANTEDCDSEEEEANAALIAAAPELYDFAHFFETFAGQCYCKILGEAGQKIYDEAVKICKKARGEE